MALGTGKDEGGVLAALDMSAQSCLHIASVGVLGNLLKLVDGDQTRLVGMFEIGEYLIECHRRVLYLPHSNAPHGIAVDVKGQLRMQ